MLVIRMRTSHDVEPSDEEKTFDLEANIGLDHSQLASPDIEKSEAISLKSLEKSTFMGKIICYPTPSSLNLRSTSWLDGVRGVAALGVYMFHAMGCWAGLVPAWHADKDQNNILQLPILRTFLVSGGTAVCLFFAISGYVLTHKSLRLIRGSSGHMVYSGVASSMFRRGFRLYLPPIFLTFCEMLTTRIGFAPPFNFAFVPESSFFGQFVDWVNETNRLINPFYNFEGAIQGINPHPKYDAVVWTIPLEFYGSFVCYILLLGFVLVPGNKIRMGLVATLSSLGMMMGSWNIFCFLAGMWIADFNLSQDENGSMSSTMPRTKGIIWTLIFVLSFYSAGMPALSAYGADLKPMPGFEFLRDLIPAGLYLEDPSRFWWSVSGVLLLLSISQLPRLKAIFETNFCQYLGKISFSLYLVHVFCVVLFGLSLQKLLMQIAGLEPNAGTVLYWLICGVWFLIFTFIVFAIAAQVERWIDVPSVKFAKWLEAKCLKWYREMH